MLHDWKNKQSEETRVVDRAQMHVMRSNLSARTQKEAMKLLERDSEAHHATMPPTTNLMTKREHLGRVA